MVKDHFLKLAKEERNQASFRVFLGQIPTAEDLDREKRISERGWYFASPQSGVMYDRPLLDIVHLNTSMMEMEMKNNLQCRIRDLLS